MAVRLVTVEEFLAKAGMDASAVPDTDVIRRFILERDLDEYVFGLIPAQVIRRYAEHLIRREPIHYGQLLQDMPLTRLDGRDLSAMTHLAVVRSQGSSVESLLVDCALGRAYCSLHGFVPDDVCYAEKAIPLTEELTSAMAGQIAAAELPPAGQDYPGDTAYRMYTILLLAFEDGVVRYVSRGLNSGMPLPIVRLCQQLLALFAGA